MYAPGTKKLTPVMRQFRDAKEAFPDAILFFRLGDFYEMFNDDAVVAAGALSLTLTSRNKGAANPVPMAGVPYHAAAGYVARLIKLGHKVAICEQMGDPKQIKGLVPRKVVRVLTPGLITETEQLDARQHNFLVALDGDASQPEALGLALLDVSTGDLAACALGAGALLAAEVARADPRELLVPAALASFDASLQLAAPRVAIRRDGPLDDDELGRWLDEGMAAPLLADASRDLPPAAVRAAARALRFARRHMPEVTLPVARVALHDPSATLHIDETAQTHLELVRGAGGTRQGSLLETIDRCVTAAGARRLRRHLLAPLVDVAAIRRRHDAVELLLAHPRARDEAREALKRIGDIERLAVRASLREATPRDLGRLRASLKAAPEAQAALASIPEARRAAPDLDLDVDLLPELAAHLDRALVDEPPAQARDGGMIREGYDAALDRQKALRRDGAALLSELEAELREARSIPSLKVKFTRAFGWHIEVTRANLGKVDPTWRRRQSLANAERYTCDALDELAERIVGAEEEHRTLELALYTALVEEVARHEPALRRLARRLAAWDEASGLAELAHEHDYIRPTIDDGDVLELGDARHPVVERHVRGGRFVPNDTCLDLAGERLLLITGPNMAGKSTLMRQVALCTILAQMGSYVPASSARIGVVDRVLSRVGASDNLAAGESTFMVEMRETASILRHATKRSLVILDEIGRGTSTFDGLAIARAVAEYLHDAVGCRAMFATHYHLLTDLADEREGVANYAVSAREHEGDIVFLHRLAPGAASRSYGVAVARLAGLPEAVLARAAALLAELERDEARSGSERASRPQLELFVPATEVPAQAPEEREVCEMLRALDPNRMTPIEALALLEQLKGRLSNT